MSNAFPSAPALLGIASARAPSPMAVVGIDLSPPGFLLFPPFVTDASGVAAISTALSSDPAVSGIKIYAQWAVLDPLGALSLSGTNFSLTPTRCIRFELP
jgi:hypothetical protein